MKTIVITPDNEKEFNFLNKLLEKLGYSHKIISEEEKEDMGLLQLMLEAQNDDNVDEKEILNLLDAL